MAFRKSSVLEDSNLLLDEMCDGPRLSVDGPKSHKDIQEWAHHTVKMLGNERCDAFRGLGDLELHVTCRWAGVGGMIIALKYIKKALEDVLQIPVKIRIHSVGDWDPSCQWMLTYFEPDHLFSNADDEFEHALVKEMANKQIKYSEMVNSGHMQKEVAIGKFKRFCEQVAKRFVPSSGAHCKLCPTGQKCLVVPACAADSRPGVLWMELASPPCTPWSMMGSRMQWLCPSQLSVLLWGMSLHHYTPDILLLEEVPQYDHWFWQTLVGDKMRFQASTGLKCCLERKGLGVKRRIVKQTIRLQNKPLKMRCI